MKKIELGNNIMINIRDNIWVNIRANIRDNIYSNILVNIWDNIWDNIRVKIGDNIWYNIWYNTRNSKTNTFNTISPQTKENIKQQIQNVYEKN